MDLLLHLIREDELEVEAIPVASVCDRFLEHLRELEHIDIDSAGDFLVMASTLVRMKSQSLLPSDVQILEDDDLDPRFELVRQLVQYRRFKQVADLLDERRAEASRQFPRGMHPESDAEADAEPTPVRLDGAGVELLFAAFARLLREIQPAGDYVITVDDTPIEVHMRRIEGLLPPGARCGFRALIPENASRGTVIGVLLAILELLKRCRVMVTQEEEFGEIAVEGRDPPPGVPQGAESDLDLDVEHGPGSGSDPGPPSGADS